MARVELTEPYAIRALRESVRDSLRSHGEEVIALQLYHSASDPNATRCHCFDDVYKGVETKNCPDCLGTGFAGGIKLARRMWAMFTTSDNEEQRQNKGEYQPLSHNVQMEGAPALQQNDILVRVSQWTKHHHPLRVEGCYVLGSVSVDSLRTGNDLAQVPQNIVGQRSKSAEKLDKSHPVYGAIRKFASPDSPVPRVDRRQR